MNESGGDRSPEEHPRCLRCGYSLRGLPGARCPECGEPFDVALPRAGYVDERDPFRLHARIAAASNALLLVVGLSYALFGSIADTSPWEQ